MAGNQVQEAAEMVVCARRAAISLNVVPRQQREAVKPLRFEGDLEQVFALLFD